MLTAGKGLNLRKETYKINPEYGVRLSYTCLYHELFDDFIHVVVRPETQQYDLTKQ